MQNVETLGEQLSEFSRRLKQEKLTHGTSGNISLRVDENTILITPTGVPYDDLTPSVISLVRIDDGTTLAGLKPSSELPMHLAVYQERQDIGAIVHTHSLYATACAAANRDIPALHYEIAPLGDSVPVIPYATYGTSELAELVSATLRQYGPEQYGFLLKNHGVLALGETLESAFDHASTIEHLAHMFLLSCSLGGPVVLERHEVEVVRRKFQGYGQK